MRNRNKMCVLLKILVALAVYQVGGLAAAQVADVEGLISKIRAPETSIRERQVAIRELGRSSSPQTQQFVTNLADELMLGKVPAAVQLEVLETVQAVGESSTKNRVEHWLKTLRKSGDPLAPYRFALVGGDSERGHDIFFGSTVAQCGLCHRVGSEGSDSGPGLTDLATRFPTGLREQILEAMVAPNAKITKGYGERLFELSDGSTISGVAVLETDQTLTILQAESGLRIVAREEIEAQSEPRSIMSAVGETLTLREMRDLIEFLSQAKL